MLIGCKNKEEATKNEDPQISILKPKVQSNSIILPFGTTDTILYVESKGVQVPVYVSIPAVLNNFNLPAMVLLHGSGGMWKDDSSSLGIMSEQNREWRELFDSNRIVGAYVDSYEPRGCIERDGVWKDAPLAFQISSQFVRPFDAYAALDLLRKLAWPNGKKIIRSEDVGLIGFSDGATALAATLYDTDATPIGHQWTQEYDGVEYTQADGIGIPAARNKTVGGFACGVFYYGGSLGNSYWGGSPCSSPEDYFYRNYTPILYHLPTEDPLTTNTLCAYDVLELAGKPVFKYTYINTEHGFDGADEGDPGYDESNLARERTIDWISPHLHM